VGLNFLDVKLFCQPSRLVLWFPRVLRERILAITTRALQLNPNAASAASCTKEHDPTESVDFAQWKCTKLHESAPNSKTN
jgi:hypothetical protein